MTSRLRHHDGTPFRDLNHNGTMEPYEDPRLPVDERVEDLLARMTLDEKAGQMCHGRMAAGDNGFMPSGADLIADRHITHFAMVQVPSADAMATWNNHVQDLAAATRLGIPVTLSSDPRHGFTANPMTAHTDGGFSPGPEPIGLAATDDPALVEEFAGAIARELRAVGIRVALHPMADLATEPRWARISGTFGEDADRAARMLSAYIRGMQGDTLGPDSVACMTKHFPGHGPQAGGEDSHFAYGKYQAFPGDNLEYHLKPWEAAFAAGTAQVMPCYSIPAGSGLPEVAANFNREVITGLLRGRYGFDGVVCTDFNSLSGMEIPGIVQLPPRNWGVEHLSLADQVLLQLDAGVDQLGGETRPDWIVEAVRSGAVDEARIDTSVRRILRDKFRLGLFDDPYVDVDAARALVGAPETRRLGRHAQQRSLVQLTERAQVLAELPSQPALYVENVVPEVAARYGRPVARPEEADLAVLRLTAPYEAREGFLEQHFHAGSLEFPAAELSRLQALCETVPTVLDVHLDRPAVLTGLDTAAALLVGSFGADDDLVLDLALGRSVARGSLPFDLPSSMQAIENSREDVPFDTAEPLFRCGHRATD
ncbi:glycoside hydrolase family 3 N-terminal domain-containing protein [Streptomyces sp. ML-6]|uniref:glycoside hydrolase family 3 protein n=1 Tax=Streptomyces sp. ML-6 TaxID=2982693 RepID=UPI0024C0D6BB|nr:glycoside hydrolase family 3 N-terminal domain-containing protein [Streptomyces sp. ML-6]MDK0522781.1 glycoside hydrolase family 3 protein [Streptomyces sp. ML-6]